MLLYLNTNFEGSTPKNLSLSLQIPGILMALFWAEQVKVVIFVLV